MAHMGDIYICVCIHRDNGKEKGNYYVGLRAISMEGPKS